MSKTVKIIYGYKFYFRATYKEETGVYALYGYDSHNQYRLIYIGQSDDIERDFKAHQRQICFDQYKEVEIYVHEEESKSNRKEIEEEILEKLNNRPPCNKEE